MKSEDAVSDLTEARRALELAEELNTTTRGDSVRGTGTIGPMSGQSAKDPTTLADVTHSVGETEPKLSQAMQRFALGMKRMRTEVREIAESFELAASETSRGRAVAAVLRVLNGMEPMLMSAEMVVQRALGSKPSSVEGVQRALDLGSLLDEEPLTDATDVDRVMEPRKPLDPKSRLVVDRVGEVLLTMRTRVREFGYQLQGVVPATSRPDGIRASVTDLSELVNVLTTVRHNIKARFPE